MGIVAVAGGFGDVGRTIVEEIIKSSRHEVFVLTRKRKAGSPAKQTPPGFPAVYEVDYSSADGISVLLKKLNVDTVISALNLHWPEAADAQINLIRGASSSGTVSRFIPSEFNIDYNCPAQHMPYPPRPLFLQAADELRRHPNLTFTLVRNGFFMDYLGLPYVETHLQPLYCILDMAAKKALLPGDGSQHVVFTLARDVGAFVSALLDVPGNEWPEDCAIIGERIALRDLVTRAENVMGERIDLSFDSMEDLEKNVTTELPSNRTCYHSFPNGKSDLDGIICTQMIGMIYGVFDLKGPLLNNLLPHVKSTSLDVFLRDCWNKTRQNK